MDKISLEIVTPERLLFSGEVDQLFLPGAAGYLGVLPGHAPLLSELSIGTITYFQDGRETRLFCRRGFVEILHGRVTVLAEAAETPDQIDVDQAKADREKIWSLLQARDEDFDYDAAMDRWSDAQARLDAAGKGGG